MNAEGNRKKKAVWQDIVPAKPTVVTPINKPLFRLPKLHYPHLSSSSKTKAKHPKQKNYKLYIIVVLIIAIAGFIAIPRFFGSSKKVTISPNGNSTQSSVPSSGLVPGTPTYAVLLPSGKTIKQLGGGWIRDKSHPLFVYIDKIGTTQINVSEQPLPDDFKADPGQEVESIAQSYNITQKVTVGSTIVHIGTFDKGIQRIILTKSNLLILITSSDNLTNDQWIAYISSLS